MELCRFKVTLHFNTENSQQLTSDFVYSFAYILKKNIDERVCPFPDRRNVRKNDVTAAAPLPLHLH